MAVTRSQSAGKAKATAKPAISTEKKAASISKTKKSASVPKSKKTSKARKVLETTEANENTDWARYTEEDHAQFMAESRRRREEADKKHQEFMDNLRREDEARMADMEARSLKRRAEREARMSARKAEREARRAEWEFPSPYVKKESERLMHGLIRKHLRGRGSPLDKEAWDKGFEKCREEYWEAMDVIHRRERGMKAEARDAEASVHPDVEERGGS
ncbi:hypothetical protein LTR27_005066 [Elasticomyces elasticus]|nr:hypothetical protein LTR27_005066 [Elasticomyces elasticus]